MYRKCIVITFVYYFVFSAGYCRIYSISITQRMSFSVIFIQKELFDPYFRTHGMLKIV